jgi:hypothetical protein
MEINEHQTGMKKKIKPYCINLKSCNHRQEWKALLDQIWSTGTLMYTPATAIEVTLDSHFISAPDVL